MVIVSIKGFEKSPSEWVIKARIVFRGDAVRRQPPTSSQLLRQRALVVSTWSLLLDLSRETRVQPQTALKRMSKVFLTHHAQHMFAPCRTCADSCQAHSSASCPANPIFVWTSFSIRFMAKSSCHHSVKRTWRCWDARTTQMFSFSIHESSRLALRVYVDGLTLSGPQKNHSKFWPTLQKHVHLEDPAELSKVQSRVKVVAILCFWVHTIGRSSSGGS